MFRLFSHIIALILSLNNVKVFRVPKNVKEIMFEGVWHELKSKELSRPETCEIFEINSCFHVK